MGLIVIAGIQGAGKSTLADEIIKNGLDSNLLKVAKGKAVHFDVDKYIKQDASSMLGYKMDYDSYYQDIAESLEAKKDVVITTGPSSIRGHLKFIQNKLGASFKIDTSLIFLPCALQDAITRCRERIDKGGHSVYFSIMEAIYKQIPSFINQVKEDKIPLFQAEFTLGQPPIIKQFDDKLLVQSLQKGRE